MPVDGVDSCCDVDETAVVADLLCGSSLLRDRPKKPRSLSNGELGDLLDFPGFSGSSPELSEFPDLPLSNESDVDFRPNLRKFRFFLGFSLPFTTAEFAVELLLLKESCEVSLSVVEALPYPLLPADLFSRGLYVPEVP